MSKMCSLRMVHEGVESCERKGKGIPTSVLKKEKSFVDYNRMRESPYFDQVTFNRIGSSGMMNLIHFQQSKKGLSAYNDKVWQRDKEFSRPLGHFRNELKEIVKEAVREVINESVEGKGT